MPELDAAVLELGERPVIGLGSISREFRVRLRGRVSEQRLLAQNLQNLLGIGLPVSGAMQVAARLQTRCQLGDKFALDQAPLVVSLLVPGVRKENVHAIQALQRQHLVDHLDGVVGDDPDVGEALLADAFEQGADTGVMHFATDKVFLWHQGGNVRGGFTHAKTDFKDQGRCRCVKPVGQARLVGQHETRPDVGQRLGLSGGGAAGAPDKTLDQFRVRHALRRCQLAWAYLRVVHGAGL